MFFGRTIPIFIPKCVSAIKAMISVTVLLFAVLTMVGCSSAQPAATPTPENITVIDPPIQITDFTLTNQTGAAAHLSDFRGKLVLLAFGYTHCPDVCPVTLAHFKQVKALLGEQENEVAILFISVDGKRDTPARLREYLPLFDPAFVGMMGDEALVRNVISEFGGVFRLNDGGGLKIDYTVDHTATAFALDTDGNLVRKYAYGTEPETISADLKLLLSSANQDQTGA